MKEMDLILGPFADTELSGLTEAEIAVYEAILDENDQDLYLWTTARLSGEHPGPAHISGLLDRIAGFAAARLTPKS